MDEQELKVQNHVADHYVEKRYKGLGLKYHTEVIKEMMEGIDGKILDIGTGCGILHDLYPRLDIVGIDISPGMLKHHKGKHLLASADNIPFDNDHFDSIVCRSVLHHLHRPEKALEEIVRVLKPGGRFVCYETNKSWIASIIRSLTQHGDNFSNAHTSFSNLPSTVSQFLNIEEIRYQGFLAYPCFGFPDIAPIGDYIKSLFEIFIRIDNIISTIPVFNKLGFAVMIKARKR